MFFAKNVTRGDVINTVKLNVSPFFILLLVMKTTHNTFLQTKKTKMIFEFLNVKLVFGIKKSVFLPFESFVQKRNIF